MRVTKQVLAAFLLATAVLAAGAAGTQEKPPEIRVYYPPPRALVDRGYVMVEGRVADPDLAMIEVVVNGHDRYRVRIRDFAFAEEVGLDRGANTIQFEGGEQRQVFYAEAGEAAPRGYERVYGHFGLDDGCEECHESDDEGRLRLAAAPEKICLWCHDALVEGSGGEAWASVHRPVRDGACLRCHGAHLSRVPGLPAEKVPACKDCHAPVYERLAEDRYVHGPLNLGDCRLCHVIHSSREPGLLVRPATSLCTECHSEILVPPGTPEALRPHTMIPEGRCARCHFPHSSENASLLRQPTSRACYECHPDKTQSFHEAKGFSIYVCRKCHDLHRPNQPHLISDTSRALCMECHRFEEESTFTHGFVKEGRCFLCHTFHAAPLSADIATTCLQCHRDDPRLPEAHRGIAFEKSRCTLCHRPHQARAAKLLYPVEHTPYRERQCAACHKERAGRIAGEYRPLCLDCHRDLDLSGRPRPPAQVHPPFAERDCSACHRSHSAEVGGLLRDPQERLCLECHRKMKKATILRPTSAHTAVLEGRCHECHEPHFSEAPSLLRRPQDELCAGCHAALIRGPEGRGWASPHPPAAEGRCRLCHRSHTSNNPSLLRAPMPQECRPCHQPVFAEIEQPSNASRHRPVEEGKCAACHPVHGAAAAGLLANGNARELCGGCHGTPETGHHKPGIAVKDCLRCHLPHVSRAGKLLRGLGDKVCRDCHKT